MINIRCYDFLIGSIWQYVGNGKAENFIDPLRDEHGFLPRSNGYEYQRIIVNELDSFIVLEYFTRKKMTSYHPDTSVIQHRFKLLTPSGEYGELDTMYFTDNLKDYFKRV